MIIMEQAIVKQLDKNLKCSESIIKNEKILLKIYSTKGSIRCPDCEQKSTKVHSEVIVSSSTKFCAPACEMNGTPIGGKAPELVKILQEKYLEKFENETK